MSEDTRASRDLRNELQVFVVSGLCVRRGVPRGMDGCHSMHYGAVATKSRGRIKRVSGVQKLQKGQSHPPNGKDHS